MDNNKKNKDDLFNSSDQDMGSNKSPSQNKTEGVSQHGQQQSFDIAACRVRVYAHSLAECITPKFCNNCGHSIPFGDTNFCKHPELLEKIANSPP